MISPELHLSTRMHGGPMTPDLARAIVAADDALFDAAKAASKAGNEALRRAFAELRGMMERIPT